MEKKPVASKKLWPEGEALDKYDKAISNKFFTMNLGVKEYALAWFGLLGMPMSLLYCPLSLALLAGSERRLLTFLALLAAFAPVGHTWVRFMKGEVRQTGKYIFSIYPLALSAPIGLLLARIAGQEAFAIAAFHPLAWFTSQMPVIFLKKKFGRRRPVMSPGLTEASRMIISITKVIAQDAHASFPSGDTAGAVAYAVPLALGCGWPVLAALCVFLCAFARLYWRAHFVIDVVVGAVIGLMVSLFLHGAIGVGNVTWWQPLVAQAMMIGLMMGVRRMK